MTLGIFTMIATVVVAHFLALVSPGPDFLLIGKSAVRNRKSRALGVAFGIASANGVYILLCIIGVGSILATSLLVMTTLKILGGLFLVWVAYHALKSKKADYKFVSSEGAESGELKGKSFGKEFVTGFLSGISNPKNIIFYLSLFSVVLTGEVGLGFKIGLGVWMTSAVFLWDTLILFILSQKPVRALFGRLAFYVDKVTGTILGLIGLKLVESAIFEDRKF